MMHSYRRRVLSGPKPASRVKLPPASPLFKDWTLDELAILDVVGSGLAYREAEADREMDAARVTRATEPPSTPTPSTQSATTSDRTRVVSHWPIRERIHARHVWKNMWSKSAGAEDFRTRLVQMLLSMLAVARQTHHGDDCDRIEAELRAMGATVPE